MNEITHYSEDFPGERANYNWPVRYDITNGFLGISQKKDAPCAGTERVLLSPKQVVALRQFLAEHPVKRPKAKV